MGSSFRGRKDSPSGTGAERNPQSIFSRRIHSLISS